MAVLTRNEILKLIKKGSVKVTPFNDKQVGPASIDLALSNEFRIFKKGSKIVLDEKTNANDYTKVVKQDSIVIKPGEFIHGITIEKIKLPENVCGFLYGRSRFARMGILIHATASFIQPGINNKQVLEIKNISPRKIVLNKGLKICQLILMEMKGKAKYSGRYKNQEKV
ncbi:MAG: dCTP deaminase [Nanoarchaeota archaeon]|nr:dCTP deaminase [Nanoarchaeota archaeon]MBU4352344.1 dCTP deaminase [Nanoarchaeota archaeon]MBU4455990.1 dCTP deaminase [Nanoarchaeota archaeon]MCG2719885.1 dCTP deaminase [Nanoarchaeota archaeon]